MKLSRRLLIALLTFWCGLFAFAAEPVRILDLVPEGCAPVRQLVLQLALEENSGIEDVTVDQFDGAVANAVAELYAGKADFVLIAAADVPEGFRGESRPFMREAAALYVNGTNSLKGVTQPEARALMLAKRPVWEPLNGSKADMQRIGVKSGRAERETIARLLRVKPADVAGEFFRVGTTPEVVLLVSANSEAIGFGRLLPEYPVTVKALEIDGVAPSLDQLKSGKYPLQTVYVVLSREKKSAAAERLLKAFDTAAFMELIADNGYFPVR